MLNVFLDATVIFSAAYSNTGASRILLVQSLEGKVALYVTTLVIEEAERNITRKTSQSFDIHRQWMELFNVSIVRNPTKHEIQMTAEYTELKDAHVIAAAQIAHADYLVTFDEKHLLSQSEVAEKANLKIVRPDVVVKLIREEERVSQAA